MTGLPATDVVVVGGGIAGGALAVQLARGGVRVTVLEQSRQFRDRVRGEYMPPWGYLELVRADLLDVVMRAEGRVTRHLVPYGDAMSPDLAQARATDAAGLVPGAPGMLNLSHPDACRELLDEAAEHGARVVRGVHGVRVEAGRRPRVSFVRDNREHRVQAGLLVGADGRGSVVRRQLGVTWSTTGARTSIAGVLVDGVSGWADEVNATGTCEDVTYFLFPRQSGCARVYLAFDRNSPGRFTGAGAGGRMVQRMRSLPCFPDSSAFAHARARPGWASFPLEDTWSERPGVPGAVLIGDAAGYSDPFLGQGLSVAVRDARLVADALLGSAPWDDRLFDAYATERAERMRRLRATADAMTRLLGDYTPAGRRRRIAAFDRFAVDPSLRLPLAAELVGPDALPAEAFTRAAADRMLSPA
ncbi:MAG TPA: FAD-dependent monooxygenase [Mycobacteriales bacterium]|nr:FAD-dependent monooxygenase [Mycobacteriales bacterium]